MGNCCTRSSSTVWAGDDWESVISEDTTNESSRKMATTTTTSSSSSSVTASSLSNNLRGSSSGSSSIRGVKIRITKKELEHLLAEARLQGLSSEQVLARLIAASNHVSIEHAEDHHHQPWHPSLKSIPEVN